MAGTATSSDNQSGTHKVQPAQLTYDAAQEILSGTIGKNRPFLMKAYSGGSRGHKLKVTQAKAKAYMHNAATTLSSRFANTREILDAQGHYKQRGGTLPAGHYVCHYIANNAALGGECIKLLPQSDARAIYSPFSPHPIQHGRSGFYIHGSGPKGSDGCIVPNHSAESERRRLNQAVKNFPGRVLLLVKNVSYLLPAELEGQLA